MSTSDLVHRINKAIRGQRRGPRDAARTRHERLLALAEETRLIHEQAQAAVILDRLPELIRQARKQDRCTVRLHDVGRCHALDDLTGIGQYLYAAIRNAGFWSQCFIDHDMSGNHKVQNHLCFRFEQAG